MLKIKNNFFFQNVVFLTMSEGKLRINEMPAN